MKTRIRHIKQQQRGSGTVPKSDKFEIPEKYLTTKKGDSFLFEVGSVQESRKRREDTLRAPTTSKMLRVNKQSKNSQELLNSTQCKKTSKLVVF